MKRLYLISLPERLWHWSNALLFITLALSGLLMHASEHLSYISLSELVLVHNFAAVLFVLDFGLWLVYGIISGRIRHYLIIESDIAWRLSIQGKFYMWGIFKDYPHPFPVSEDSKFNPLQRITYLGLMFGLVPLQILSGAVLYGFTLRIEWMMDLGALRIIALIHTALSYILLAFLVGHLYLATTGETPLALLRSMFTGYHEETSEQEGE